VDDGSDEGDLWVQQLHARMVHGRAPQILDVREREEWEICHPDGAILIPLGELPRRLGELDPGREVVVYCHHGIRSSYAVALMRQAGFANPRNLVGGIDAWAQLVDTEMPVY
jgi:adenylyltransferase/sulfurtransferase